MSTLQGAYYLSKAKGGNGTLPGINTHQGALTCEPVAAAFELTYTPFPV